MLLDDPVQAGVDLEIPVIVRENNSKKGTIIPANTYTAAEFSLYNINDNTTKLVTKTLADGITAEDVDGNNIFVVRLEDTDTDTLNGLYRLDLVITDAEGLVIIPVQDELTFNPRLG